MLGYAPVAGLAVAGGLAHATRSIEARALAGFFAFVLSGLAISLTGLLLASQTGQGSGNAATGLEFSAVTAVVLGGASLAGGRGSITGTILGVLVIGVVNNGIVLLNIESFWQDVTRGTLLIFAVAVDQLRLRLTRD